MSKRVLIVDDAVFMRMMIKDILEKMALKLLGSIQWCISSRRI